MERPGNEISDVVDMILSDYDDDKVINRIDIENLLDKQAITDIAEKLMKILYPGYYSDKIYKIYSLQNNMAATIEDVIFNLKKQMIIVLKYCSGSKGGKDKKIEEEAERKVIDFMKRIPAIRNVLETDIDAAFDGDPAAFSKAEIIISYPGLFAISIYRIAHELFELEVPLIPRIMTEYAHGKTGIDIHPGATIGRNFFIDHGTGIVIGETTEIGEHVKIYQGVTLGGLSTKGGRKRLNGKKRHPTIGNNVTIYSGASILGGETVIGDNVVVGGNSFIVNSIAEGTKVSMPKQELKYSNQETNSI